MNFKDKLQILIYPFIIFPIILIILINFFINTLKTKDMQYEILENHLNNILSICKTENDIISRLKMNDDQYYSEAVRQKALSEITKNAYQNEITFILKTKTKKILYFTGLNNDLRKNSLANIKYIDDMINIKNGRIEFTEQIDEKSQKKCIAVYKYYPEWDWLIAVSLRKDYLYKYVYSTTYLSLIITAIFLIILIIILYMISLGISKPLKQLEEGTTKIALNDYDVNINIKSNDEFGNIAKKFNIMADKIREYSIKNDQIIKDLQENKKNFKTVADFTYGWETWISPEGNFFYVSPSCLRITGYTAEEFINDFTLFTKIIHPNDRTRIKKHLQEILKKNSIECTIEFRIITRNNEERWIEHNCQGVFSTDGKWLGQRASNRDVSIRKQAEENVKRERTLLKRITETSPIGIALVNTDGMITFANNQVEKILGLTKDEITQRTYNAPEWRITDFNGGTFPDEKLPFRQIMTNKKPVYDIQHAIEWPDGRRVYLSINGAPLFGKSGKIESIVFSLEDITERKRAENELRESEKTVRRKLNAVLSPETDIGELELSDIIDSERIQNLMDEFYRLTNVGIGIIDLKGNVLVGTGWQDICTKFHRINKESCKLCIESDLELSKDIPEGTFKQYKCKNNMWDIATPIMLGNRHVGNIFLGQFLYDDEIPDYEIFRQQARLYGFDEKEYIAALNKVPRWSRQKVETVMNFYTALAGLIGNLSYSNIKLAKTLEDQKRMDEILRVNEERYRMAQEIGHIGNWEYNIKTTEFWGSDEAKRIYGFKPNQLNFSTDEVENCIPEREKVHQVLVDLIDKDKPYNIEFEIHPLNSSEPKIITSIAVLIKDKKGVPLKVIGVIQDITKRKQAEQALKESESHLKSLIHTIPDLVWLKTPEGVYLSCNQKFEEFFGAKEEEIIGKTDYDFVDKELADFFREHDLIAIKKGTASINEEWITFASDGHKALLETIKMPMYDNDGKLIGVLGIGRDITERQLVKEKIKTALDEKEALLKELYHRTKNNMMIICAMLNLHSNFHPDNITITEAFKGMENRIHSMALVHEKLYQAQNLSSINMKEYLLDIINLLNASYNINNKISFNLEEIEDIILLIDTAIPCGLIINELISNSLKHAFPGEAKGIITIKFKKEEDDELNLQVSDNGIGLEKKFDFEKDQKMGLTIIQNIVKSQLMGKVKYLIDNGTTCTIHFKDIYYKKRI